MSEKLLMKPLPLRMRLKGAAAFIGVGARQFQHLVSQGRIKFVKDHPNGERLYKTEELQRYVAEQQNETVESVA